MTMLLLKNARIVDGSTSARPAPTQVVIEHDRIREVGAKAKAANAEVIDLAGKTLMPGLIDCHVHTIAVLADLGRNAMLPDSLVTARATPRDARHADARLHDRARRRRCGFWPEMRRGGGDLSRPTSDHFRQGAEPDRRALRLSRSVQRQPRAKYGLQTRLARADPATGCRRFGARPARK